MGVMYMTRAERYFKEQSKFEPKRWIKGEKESANVHPYSHLPFGFGARMCIGRRIAEQEIYTTIAKVSLN